MDYLIQTYFKRCKSELTEYKFKRQRHTLVRVVNDMIQNFTISSNRRGGLCKIEFGVFPLCSNSFRVGRGVYLLKQFEINPSFEDWVYDSESIESIDSCVSDMLLFIKKHLIPFFERANHSTTALAELIKLEKLFNDNRVAGLKIRGIEDGAGHNSEVRMIDDTKYYIALKSGDYEFALRCRYALLQQNIEAYEKRKDYDWLDQDIKEEDKEKIEKLREEITRLKEKDYIYFEQLVLKNEEYAKKELKAFF